MIVSKVENEFARYASVIAYFISAPERSESWSVDAVQLKAQLRARWPEVQFSDDLVARDFHPMEWQLRMADGSVEGAPTRDGQALILTGHVRDCT